MFHRRVIVVQAVVVVATAVTIVLLLTVPPTVAAVEGPADVGAALFTANCSGGHGLGGEGGVGPALAGGLARFETIQDVITFVSTGVPGRMPGFETRLSPDEISAIVQFVWTDLAGK